MKVLEKAKGGILSKMVRSSVESGWGDGGDRDVG